MGLAQAHPIYGMSCGGGFRNLSPLSVIITEVVSLLQTLTCVDYRTLQQEGHWNLKTLFALKLVKIHKAVQMSKLLWG